MEIKNLKKVANRIKKAIRNQERIILYGDADLDGVTSVIILEESIKNLAGDIAGVYFPDREKEGYGLNKFALDFLKKETPALLFTLDCGIGNFEEVKIAQKIGFEVIIIDHHEILDRLPQASIIVNPKQKGDQYPFKELATVGIVYKLSQVLLKDKLSDVLKKNFLELVGLATLADMMPEVDENKMMIEESLSFLRDTWRPGLKVFFNMDEIGKKEGTRIIAQRIISILNVVITEMTNHLNKTYLLLTSNSIEEAEILARELLEKREEKQEEIKEIERQIQERLLKKSAESIIFEGDSSWPSILIGSVASRICRQSQKPTFIFRKKEKENRGAVRTPAGVNAVAMMKKCSKYLLSFGGHPQAAGFVVKNENLEKFKNCLIQVYEKNYHLH